MSDLSQSIPSDLAKEMVERIDRESARGFEALASIKSGDRITLDGAYGLSALELHSRAVEKAFGASARDIHDAMARGGRAGVERLLAERRLDSFSERAMNQHEQADGAQSPDERVAENMPIDRDPVDDQSLAPTQFENEALALRRRLKTVAAEVKSTIAVVITVAVGRGPAISPSPILSPPALE